MERAMKVQEVISRAEGERDYGWPAAEKIWARRAVEKTLRGKVQRTDFPTSLGNPANPAGFPLSHSLGDCERLTKNRTFHLLRKRGHF
jgi:hypothetical protein